METQTVEDKLAVLVNIFGNDLTESLIADTLKANNGAFDPTVEKLLTLPANKPKETNTTTQPAQPQAMDPKSLDNIKRLHTMFGDLTQSVITTVYESNKRDVEGTVDTLLNLTSNEVASGARREAEVARQEEELRAYEEFRRSQQRLQEEERRATEAAQQSALQRAKEEEQKRKAAEEAQKKELEKKAQDEHSRALQEQERMLLEFQRKKVEQEKADSLKMEEQAARAAREAVEKAKIEKERLEKIKLEKEKLEKEKVQLQQERIEKEKLERLRLEKERLENEEKLRQKARKLAEEKLEKERLAQEEVQRKLAEERKLQEERIAVQRLKEQNEKLQQQNQQAEAERKLLEARMKEELQRDAEDKKRAAENEKRFKEEQENIRRNWEEKVKKLENERRLEEQRRAEEEAQRLEAKRLEEEERARQEADMRRILELERLKLDEQRKRIEEEKKSAETRLKAMEEAARLREEEEAKRLREEENRRREEEESARLLQEEAQARERIKEEQRKALEQEQFAASAIIVPNAADEPQVEVIAETDGSEIRGSWAVVKGVLPAQAWLGLFARRAINTNSGYMYITGNTGEFSFKGLTPGYYEVRVFANKAVTSRIVESSPLLIGPKVLNFSAQLQGSQLMMEYTLDPPVNPSGKDWVGVYEKSQRRNQNYTSSGYGNNTGIITMQLPRTPGVYEARLFVTGAKYNDQASLEFVVEDNDKVTGEIEGEVIKASWVMRTVEPTSSDWIGLFAAGEPSNKYLASVYTAAASEGKADISVPKDIAKGLYELRLFSSKVGKYTTFKTSDVITIN